MSNLLVGALSVLMSTNPPAAVSNIVTRSIISPAWVREDPRSAELREIMELDESVERTIDSLVERFRNGDPSDPNTPSRVYVELQIAEQFGRVRERYADFVRRHPDHLEGRLAYASFLEENGATGEALDELRKAVEIRPDSPAAWNNLANHLGHYGGVIEAFPAYEKAIALRPFEALYHYNLATTVFLFRKDAMEYYQCDEQAVFDRALSHYRKVRELRPDHFRYAYDYAQTYYGVKPAPAETVEGRKAAEQALAREALSAWRDALAVADNDLDREGVHVHMARWHLKLDELDEARAQLARVQDESHQVLKERIRRNVEEREALIGAGRHR